LYFFFEYITQTQKNKFENKNNNLNILSKSKLLKETLYFKKKRIIPTNNNIKNKLKTFAKILINFFIYEIYLFSRHYWYNIIIQYMEKKLSDFGNYLINLNIKKKFFYLTLIIILKVGIWYHPALWKLLEISIDPFSNTLISNPYSHYLYYNFLGGFLGNLFGFNTKITFFLYHLFFSIIFFYLYVHFVFKKLSNKYATFSVILFLVLPVSTTSFFWVGYDSIILSIMMISIILSRYLTLVFILGILLGLQHFELTFLAALSLLVLNIYNKFSKRYFLLN